MKRLVTGMLHPSWKLGEKRSGTVPDARLDLLERQLALDLERVQVARSRLLRDPGHTWQTLQIGITDLCNLICAHCTRLPKQQGLQGTLSVTKFARYLSCFSPDWFTELLLSDWGEPTIVPQLSRYLHIAKRTGWDNVHFFTNGTCTDEALFDEIVAQMLLQRLIVSVEGASPEIYEKIRRNRYETFRSFLNIVTRYRDMYRSPIELLFNVVCMKSNLNELPSIIQMAAEYKVDQVFMVHLNPVTYLEDTKGKMCIPAEHLDAVDRKIVLDVFERVLNTAESNGISVCLPEPFPELSQESLVSAKSPFDASQYRCEEALRWVQVGFDGGIYPCCQMGKTDPMGNLNDLDFYSIWNNLKYRRLLEGLLPNGTPLDVCCRCNMLAGKKF